jgi:DNA-binding response OmpR family regulator
LADLLRRLGSDVDVAESAEAAKEKLNQRRYDLALVDLDLPDTAGDVLARWVQETLPKENHPVLLAVSAFELDEVRKRSSEAGMDGFIGKPVTAEKLHAIVVPLATRFQPIAVEHHEPLLTYVELLAKKDPDAADRLRREAHLELQAELRGISAAWHDGDRPKAMHHTHRLISVALLIGNQPLVIAAKDFHHALVQENNPHVERLLSEMSDTQIRSSEHQSEELQSGGHAR